MVNTPPIADRKKEKTQGMDPPTTRASKVQRQGHHVSISGLQAEPEKIWGGKN